jgi:hypothetical protein
MRSKRHAASESLHLAFWWERTRAGYLRAHNRKTEAIDAEMEVSKYRQRIRDELGVEVSQ